MPPKHYELLRVLPFRAHIRVPIYNTASSINARYMPVVQATLLPVTFHTRQAV